MPMVHLLISFVYVMAGVAAAVILPSLVGWARPDITAVIALLATLVAANIHFFVVQTERLRRVGNNLERLQFRHRDVDTAAELLRAEFDSLVAAQNNADAINQQRLDAMVGDVAEVSTLIAQFLQKQKDKEIRRARESMRSSAKATTRTEAGTQQGSRAPDRLAQPVRPVAKDAEMPSAFIDNSFDDGATPTQTGTFPAPEAFTMPEHDG